LLFKTPLITPKSISHGDTKGTEKNNRINILD
jgi:hypothetical protein